MKGMHHKITYLVVVLLLFFNNMCSLNVCAQVHEVKHISFASNRTGNFDIYLIDTNSENLRRLTKNPADEFSHSWSPDGQLLAYGSNREGVHKLYVMDTKTNEQRRLTHSPGEENFPTWSPDGKWIAYTFSNKPLFQNADIYVIEAMGNGPGEPLVKGLKLDLSPTWVPELFFAVSLSSEKQTTLWGHLKKSVNTDK